MHNSAKDTVSESVLPESDPLPPSPSHLKHNPVDGVTTKLTESQTLYKTSEAETGGLQRLVTNVKILWSDRIVFSIAHDKGTLVDHLANERTYHNWLALSNACAWVGIVILQMSKIHNVVRPDHYNMFRYKACICQILAILILLVGTCRFFCEQGAINQSSTRAHPWSLLATGGAILILCLSFFVMIIIANTDLVDK